MSMSVGSNASSGSAFLRILSYLHLYSCLWGCVVNGTGQTICTTDKTKKRNLFLSWTSFPVQFTSLPHKQPYQCYWHRTGTGKVEQSLPCRSQARQRKQSRSSHGYRCHKAAGSQGKTEEKKTSIFCNLIILVLLMTLLRVGGWKQDDYFLYRQHYFLRIGQRHIFQTGTSLTKQLFAAGNILLPLPSPGQCVWSYMPH